jgi:DNA-binding protein H-NS
MKKTALTPKKAPLVETHDQREIDGADFCRAMSIPYAHPENRELTWTGRGRKPRWVEFWLNNGGTLEQLRVDGRCTKTLDLPLAQKDAQ